MKKPILLSAIRTKNFKTPKISYILNEILVYSFIWNKYISKKKILNFRVNGKNAKSIKCSSYIYHEKL